MKFLALQMIILCFAIASVGKVLAQSIEVEMQRIQAFVEAGDIDRALRHYDSLLQDRLTADQRATIEYNMGTALLYEGQIDKALSHYHSISTNAIDNPLLQQRLDANIALSKLMQVQEVVKNLEDKKELSYSDYSLAIISLRDTLDAISKAEKSACLLSEAEGSSICVTLPELNELLLETKRLFAGLLNNYFKYKLEHISLQGGSVELLIGLETLLDNVNFLIELPDSLANKAQYKDLFFSQAKQWEQLWDGLETVIENQPSTSSEYEQLKDIFNKAKQSFVEATRALKEDDLIASQQSFLHSKTAIEEAIRLIFNSSDLNETVHQLLVLYELVLVQEPLQEISLEVLQKIMKQMESLVEAQASKELKDQYTTAVQDLEMGKKAVEQLQLVQGRMFVLAAHNEMKVMVNQLNEQAQKSPVDILEQAIQLEALAYQLNILKQSAEGKEPPMEGSQALLLRVQQSVFPVLEKFFKVTINQQIREFRSPAPTEGPDLRCQVSPWDQAIPLIFSGKKNAETAKTILTNAMPLLGKVADAQAAAIKKWQEALAQLKAPKKARKKEKQEDNKQEKEDKKQKEDGGTSKEKQPPAGGGSAEQKTAPGKPDLNNVLRLLQEMEKDDRSKPKIVPKDAGQGKQDGNIQQGRPW